MKNADYALGDHPPHLTAEWTFNPPPTKNSIIRGKWMVCWLRRIKIADHLSKAISAKLLVSLIAACHSVSLPSHCAIDVTHTARALMLVTFWDLYCRLCRRFWPCAAERYNAFRSWTDFLSGQSVAIGRSLIVECVSVSRLNLRWA